VAEPGRRDGAAERVHWRCGSEQRTPRGRGSAAWAGQIVSPYCRAVLSHLLTWRGVGWGLWAAVFALGLQTLWITHHDPGGLFNDFYLYWGGAKLLARGHSPYDLPSLQATLTQAGVHPTISLGYIYPLLLAYILVPFALLPPLPAALLFSALGLVALTTTVALLLTPLARLPWWEHFLLAAGAGSFISVAGSLYFGQANLLLLPFFALVFRGVARPLGLALISAIKLYPLVGFLAFWPRGSSERQRLGLGLAGFAVLAVAPNLIAGAGAGPWLQLFTPDAYWSNESLNGFVSRLGGGPFASGPALLPGLPMEAVMLAVSAALGLAVMAVVLLAKGRPWDGCLTLLFTYGAAAAPHNSLWNFAPLLVTATWCWPRLHRRPALLAVFLLSWVLINVQAGIYTLGDSLYHHSPAASLLGSLGLYGVLILGTLNAFLLLENKSLPQSLGEPLSERNDPLTRPPRASVPEQLAP
jgi:hypothetical protein